ncbi:hypothetical protein SJPD1_2529 [Sulfurospirillum diekertiae]|uniref:Uncharacterized protein n=1 Tax=Sulfurospirillum diekertiae TaxID=1854492 RepID=A0A290HVE9_9BACT|nr:tetratricopeptide repeat protein [Sulfurospirillum diekertiae]ATB70624.1 hypothetical protein SJPD1_2529 [Sulfurospirillum diekertiae]
MKKIFGFLTVLIFVVSVAHAEPTIHQVYEAAQAGKLSEAHTMVEEVLKAHPQSAKAHFVNAEILSAQGQITQARSELSVAEQLEPGLPFAKPQAIQTLKDKLGLLGAPKTLSNEHQSASSSTKPFPWTTALLFGGGALVFVFLIRSAFSRKSTSSNNGLNGGTPPTASYPNNAPMNPSSPQGGGMGSGIASGLATGLAAGVGVAAGEALFNHFANNNASTPNVGTHTAPPVDTTPQPSSSDFGDNDFGINDSASWDDSSSGDSMSDSSSDSW